MARSPNYPQLNLADAIDGIRKVWNAEEWNKVSQEVVAKHLGYSSLNGSAQVVISALKKYGLLEGSGGSLKVSKDAVTLVERERAADDEYRAAIKRAAMNPKLFEEISAEYDSVPSEDNLFFALLKKDFTKAAATKAAKAYRETMQLVCEATNGYDDGEATPGEESVDEKPEIAAGDYVQWESQGVLQFPSARRVTGFSDDGAHLFVEGTKTGIPLDQVLLQESPQEQPSGSPGTGHLHRKPPFTKESPMQRTESHRQDVFALTEGEAVIQWPTALSSESYEDFKDWVNLVLRKVKRSVSDAEPADLDEP